MTMPERSGVPRPPRILIFDSGMGGLTVARAIADLMPEAGLIYAADSAAFPYGAWEEAALVRRISSVVETLIGSVRPDVFVVACNTATTLAIHRLRLEHPDMVFVGTVPAIKPAAEATRSGIIGVLATPATVQREYTNALIHTYAYHCEVVLHGAARLAQMVEHHVLGHPMTVADLQREIAPAFKRRGRRRTDVVVLGCTHYPLVLDALAEAAPWPVRFIDPAPSIARRVRDVLPVTEMERFAPGAVAPGHVLLTAVPARQELLEFYRRSGFPDCRVADVPA